MVYDLPHLTKYLVTEQMNIVNRNVHDDGNSAALERLERWYRSMTSGDWHETYGIFISNIDNPGWTLRVELSDTYLEEAAFESVKVKRDEEQDWVICRVSDLEFIGHGGPENLGELITRFLDWAELNR